MHHQGCGDNVHFYQEDHLSLYLHFSHFFSVNENNNAAYLLRAPGFNEHHQTHGGFDQYSAQYSATGPGSLVINFL